MWTYSCSGPPPFGEAIKIMWAQERYSLYPSDWHRARPTREKAVSFGSIRAIRSAASHYWMWDLLVSNPSHLTLGFKDKPLIVAGCSPTDEAMYTFFANGMKLRLGDHPKPSAVLLIHHILWLNNQWELEYARPDVTSDRKIEICRAAITTDSAYMGWLRAVETFCPRWEDLDLYQPHEGPEIGLPAGVGAVLLRLLEHTTSSQDRHVDVILAFTSASGLQLGRWYSRLWHHLPAMERQPDSHIIAHRDGRVWTSHYYRYTHLYPLLFALRALGDPYFAKYADLDSLIAAFHGFHTFKRTGRTVASRKRVCTVRPATMPETVEHGRWSMSRTSLDMPLAYLEWSVEDRICISLFCL
jgi:hypothetical protein